MQIRIYAFLVCNMKNFLFFLILLNACNCSSIEPLAYNPNQAPEMVGVLTENYRLTKAELIAQGKIIGPEGLDLDSFGNIYAATADGSIYKIKQNSNEPILFARTGGRPLGIQFDNNGNLIVCDAYKGLLSLDKHGKITDLTTTSEDGIPFKFTDDLDISKDGTIYFTDASFKYQQTEYLYDLMEAKPHGRLLKYDPKTKTTSTLLKDLYFANGVALSKNEEFLLVNETYRYRITRFWLKGPKKGTSDIFIDNLAGFPDNISRGSDGNFYLALFTVRNQTMDKMHPSPWKKKVVASLPKFLWPKPQPFGFVAKISMEGNIMETYQDPSGEHLKEITHAVERDGYLYLGSLHNDRIGKFKLNN